MPVPAHFSVREDGPVPDATAFGVQQMVDIGSKALSPGINDASTAVLCIDRLTQVLVRLATRRIETPLRTDDGELRVIARGPTFESLVDLAYHTLRNDAASKPLVIRQLLRSIERVAAATSTLERRRALASQAAEIAAQARRAEPSRDWQEIIERATQLDQALRHPLPHQAATLASDAQVGSCRGDVGDGARASGRSRT